MHKRKSRCDPLPQMSEAAARSNRLQDVTDRLNDPAALF